MSSGFNLGFIDRAIIRHFDWGLFVAALAVPLFGLVVLYSAGFNPDVVPNSSLLASLSQSQPFLRQVIFLIVGLVVMAVAASISPQTFYRYAYVIYAIGILLLVAVALGGTVVNGSRRWIPLVAGFSLQPAELMKVGIILCMARYLSRNPPRERAYGLKQLAMPLGLILLPMAFIMKQPDLGSALAVGMIGGIMVLFMGVRLRLIVITLLIAAAVAPFAWHKLHGYQQRRILTLINPEADPRGSGYHITQSIIAVGSGEFVGKGFMQGTQTQLEFLPEHHTDFIFSVLAEEWGFIGAMVLLGLYLLLIQRLLRVSSKSKDLFTALVALGVAILFGVHVVINMGMVIGVLPVVGIPLPLFSYGGSAVLTLMFGLGTVMGISMRRLVFSHGGS
ncbi:MAG: rod shape-determining protein RodA [Proteobacteria bacterium]|nr:rod shape-determining protein RodA [Pseudomonadota bacterium]